MRKTGKRTGKRGHWLSGAIMGCALLGLAAAGSASAAGIGAYVGYSGDKGTIGDVPIFVLQEVDTSSDRIDVGFLYDSHPRGDDLFSYRFEAGYSHGWANAKSRAGLLPNPQPYDRSYETNGFATNHYFTFGVVRNERVRFWLAPVVGLSLDFPDIEGSGTPYSLSVGGGGALGANFHVNEHLSLTASAGYQYRWRHADISFDSEDIDFSNGGGLNYWMVNVGFLFNTDS